MKMLPIDELNTLTETIKKHPRKLDGDDIIDTILGVLIMSYKNGIDDACEMVDIDYQRDFGKLMESLNKEYDGKTWQDRVLEYRDKDDGESIARVIETEAHRNYNQGIYDCVEQSDENVIKTWRTMLDERTRDTHAYLEGAHPADDGYFYTFDGDKGRFPGDFSSPENNVNCRCYLSLENA